MTIRDELLARRDGAGIIRVDEVLGWAETHPGSALHRALDWNDASAAQKYRRYQIRQLIAVYVIDDDGNRQTISLMADRGAGGGYREIEQVFDHAAMRAIALAEALADLERLREKYQYLSELAEVYAALDRIQEARPPRRRRVAAENRPAA